VTKKDRDKVPVPLSLSFFYDNIFVMKQKQISLKERENDIRWEEKRMLQVKREMPTNVEMDLI
jgi:hypothetical protein